MLFRRPHVLLLLTTAALAGRAGAADLARGAAAKVVPTHPVDARRLPGFATRQWTTRDGLPQDTVTDLVQDDDGFLWITTFGGIARYDGVRFEVYDVARGEGITTNRFLSAFRDHAGTLWFGSEDAGVTHYAEGAFESPVELAPLTGASVWDIAETPAGDLWFATDGGLYQLSPHGLARFTPAEGLPSVETYAVYVDPAGTLWVGTRHGLARSSGAVFVPVGPPVQARNLAPAPDGALWVGASSGVLRLEGDTLTPVVQDDLWTNTMTWDASGRTWVSTDAGPAVFDPAGPVVQGGPSVAARPPLVRVLLTDREGGVWAGTNGQGLYRFSDEGFERVPLPAGAPTTDVGPMLEDREGTLWVGSACAGLGRVAGATIDVVVPDVCVRSLAEDPTAGLWYTEDRILAHRLPDGTIRRYGPADGLPDTPLRALAFDLEGTLWVATNADGVYRREGARFVPEPKLEYLAAETIAVGPDGVVWFGTSGGLARLAQGEVTRITTADGLPNGAVRAILPGSDGIVWVGTYGGGLARVDGTRITVYTTREGLLDNTISRILDDGAGSLWLNGNHGVSRVRRADLDAFVTDPETVLHVVALPTGEGSGGNPAGTRARDGRMWFPTIEGAVCVDTNADARAHPAPRMRLLSATMGGARLTDGLRSTSGDRDVVIRFAAPTLFDQTRIRYRYRLVGYRDGWTQARESRAARYTNLPPGDYRFEVVAADLGGAWTTDPATVSFTIVPRFTETRWFQLVLAAAGFLLAGLLFQRRLVETRRRQQHYRDIFDQASNGFLLQTPDGTLVEANATACALLDLSRDKLGGIARLAFVEPASRDLWGALVRRAAAGERITADGLFLLRGERSFEVRVTGSRHTNGGVHALLSFVDVTEERRLADEKRLVERQLLAAQKLEAVGKLAGGIAHDFNNLMTVILAQADLLGSMLGGEAQAFAEEIRAHARKGARLTRQLLAFSRSQMLKPTRIDLRAWLGLQERILRAAVRDDIRIRYDVADDVPAVRLDPTQLEQTLLNLVFNACDAMPQGGTLTLSVRREVLTGEGGRPPGTFAVLAVTDTGTGMDAGVQQHMFEPFFTTKPQGKGTGLGLAAVHGFVVQSGGFVTVTSAPGAGSRFDLHLPATTEPDVAVSEAPPTPLSSRKARILVCDDEPGVARSVTRILTREGHVVSTATSPAEALQLLDREPVDLLLTDVVMPEMKGTELAARVRAKLPGVAVVFMSGHNREDTLAGELFVEKPFAADELAAAIQAALGDRGPTAPPPG